jgi:hypothetical protein
MYLYSTATKENKQEVSDNDFIGRTVEGEYELGEVGGVRHVPDQRHQHQHREAHQAEPPQVSTHNVHEWEEKKIDI